MSDWVNETRAAAIVSSAEGFDRLAARTESPIERALFWGLVGNSKVNKYVPEGAHWLTLVDWDHMWTAWVTPQDSVAAGDKKYRADFLVRVFITLDDAPRGIVGQLAVECDGHDFHERTKEQAANDRSRDRAMLAAGVQVVRFTGSEIFRSPFNCADEVLNAVQRAADSILKPYFAEWGARYVEEKTK